MAEALSWLSADVWEELNWLMRVVIAGLFAAVIGYERERAGKAAGLRTHILVGVATCTFVCVGQSLLHAYSQQTRVEFDPIRLIDAVASGIGFLGAGIIFVSRRQDRVRGLTTAASVWGTSALAVAVGFQRYLFAGSVTVILFAVLRWLELSESIEGSK